MQVLAVVCDWQIQQLVRQRDEFKNVWQTLAVYYQHHINYWMLLHASFETNKLMLHNEMSPVKYCKCEDCVGYRAPMNVQICRMPLSCSFIPKRSKQSN